MTKLPIVTVEIRLEHDVVFARQRARQLAEGLGFQHQDQVRLATAVSELARNAYQYAGGGKVEFILENRPAQFLLVRVTDHGPGIARLKAILAGEYVSETGMGVGLIGSKRLMDEFQIESSGKNGTKVVIGKQLPQTARRVTPKRLEQIVQALSEQQAHDPFSELQRQNQDLLAVMAELEKRQGELSQLNRELEDTNRGVVALYAELDQRADYLKQVSEAKTRFLSNMTHEFRTPLNSIISISRMLAERLDGSLTAEQDKQVGYIRRAAADLAHLVNDLLDLAKVEAGKVSVRIEAFDLRGLFGSLRGTLRPLLSQNSLVNLVFEEPEDVPVIESDESKLSQILRNFISNALKYTERGEVRVGARRDGADHVLISVADTGIGIAPENLERVFEEFEQVEGPHQKAKGTGLGLPLSRKLAELLKGTVTLESELGVGTTISVRLPIHYVNGKEIRPAVSQPPIKVLVIDDDEASRYVLKDLLSGLLLTILEAGDGEEGLRLAAELRPRVIFLDLVMPGMSGFQVLAELKSNPFTREIPVIVNTSRELDDDERAQLARAAGIFSKNQPDFKAAREQIQQVLGECGVIA
ncbi:MAG TPA: ATP-binding protein [Verrucomicrobiae bacterium]|nr:ATP-binding protein [Verrucomicrobiae bacterium]